MSLKLVECVVMEGHLLGALVALVTQIQMGAAAGRVVDPSQAGIPGARVLIYDSVTGFERRATTDERGRFRLYNLPFGTYALRVEAPGFRVGERELRIRSNLAVELVVALEIAGASEELDVRATSPLVEADKITTSTTLDESFVARSPGARPGAGLQALVATAPGWASEDNGLLHSRGVDDGFLFVTDGIPLADRVDTFFSSSFDTEAVQSIEILDGHLPVEYGNASGGVINIVPKSGLGEPVSGTLSARGGSQRSGEAAFTFGGDFRDELGFFATGSYGGSAKRYLDPVDPENFNNSGSVLRLSMRIDWRPTEADVFVANLAANGSDFRVTNSLEQELAGQRQRQELRDDHGSVVWQRTWNRDTVTDVAWYRHGFEALLLPSENDTPFSARQDRGHIRQGVLFNVTHVAGDHLLEAGTNLELISPRERFVFFVTEPDLAEETGISEDALAFDLESPFLFDDAVARAHVSGYIQDTFSLFDRLTVNAGLRFDRTALLVEESELSPRIGAVYYLAGTRTAVRGSYNRLFMPPQVENLLLSSSEEARELSPFVTEAGEGGAVIFPETQHAFELGIAQALGEALELDVAYWHRSVRNFADPNVFFGTTIIFPNSVAEGTASGVNVRLEIPHRKGWSGFVSYSNSLVYQRGPVNGGLFLEEEVIEIGPGTKFVPDHDQRNVGAFGVTYQHAESGTWAAFYGRHESGTPLEVDEDELDEVMERRGAELVDFERGRVKPRTLFDLSFGISLLRERNVSVEAQVDVRNIADQAFAYNFSNPFSGTHFGHPRLVSGRVKVVFGR